jgi:hypothetical protein
MGLRQREWARKQRLKLCRLLGLQCKQCSSRDYRKLEFDCIKPIGDNHGKKEWSWRISIYRQQHKNNNLQLLCDKCHNKKTAKENSNTPF